MIEIEHGPAVAPGSYYVQQATVAQAMEQLRITAKVVFWSLIALNAGFGALWWGASVLEIESKFDSLISIHVSTEGKILLFAALSVWWVQQGRKKGISWRDMAIGAILAVPALALMLVLPSWAAGPVCVSSWIVLAFAGGMWDDLYRCGRENCERIADLDRKLTEAEAELTKECKARDAFYGRDW